ncbi:putative SAM-dependent methyltransferase [Fructilactobacillus florum 8D]|uniref:Putative SAM-dependent methyltransferase n=1 Tax=Fructilactobacillus florum 8D TaxID=1221538 RepID=W9EF49_9LACO|nr:hypothetical protein [Fructilactobacillus florum]EKK21112.1 putative SAM-dependent methyltransferase [Fructilactobacillus florum 2F]ETO40702.1 putative SAM-dependent methyltransferase [Fructilactobacillus florum 8D]
MKKLAGPKHPYIQQLQSFQTEFSGIPIIQDLIKQILQADHAITNNQLPQPLPQLLLPTDIQDQLYHFVNQRYPLGDRRGDQLWDHLINDLPRLDQQIRSFRDYLEEHYGMWAYLTAPFISRLADFLAPHPVLEIMAGNGYLSRGLRKAGAQVIATDSLAWKTENQTGRNLVTEVLKKDALQAYACYHHQVDYVLMCWSPDNDPVDWELLQAMRADQHAPQLLVIGERDGATNSHVFWEQAHFHNSPELATLNQSFNHFDLLNDQIYLIS